MNRKTWVFVGAMVIGAAAMLAGCEGESEMTPTPTPATTPTQALLARSPTGTPTARATPSPTSPSPTLPPPAAGETPLASEVLVQNEIARLQKVGLAVDEVIRTSLDGTNQHVAMRVSSADTENFDPSLWEGILQFSSPTPSDGIPGRQALLLYEVNGEELVRIFDRLDFYVSLQPEYGQMPELVLGDVDVDADGVPELVVHAHNGTNCWECGRLVIYTVRDHEVTEVPIDLPTTGLLGYDGDGDGTSAVPARLEDVDGDGRYEVIALDASWELHGFCHACSPSAVFVLAWDGQRYSDASSRFPDYFQSRIEELEAVLPTIDTRDFTSGDNPEVDACLRDQDYMSVAVSILLNYGRSGRAQEGWARYSELTEPAKLKSQVWRDSLPMLKKDLELSVPRDGRPPTSSVQGSSLLDGLICWGTYTEPPLLTATPAVEPTLPATVVITPTATTPEPATLEGIETSQEVMNSFPEEVVFRLSARSEGTIEEVTLHYQILPDGIMAHGRPDFTPAEHVQVDFHLKGNDPPRSYLAPGAEIDYFWEVEDDAGNKLTTDPATFIYEDIRFSWQSISDGNLTIYWYAGSSSSAESSLAVARETLNKMSTLLGVTVDYPLKVLIYDSYQDMLPALVHRSGGQAVVVAGMRVASDTVLMQGEGADDTLRHELTHIVTHVAGEGPYGSLPTWLDEGTAMYGQSEPGEGFTSALEEAVSTDSLLSVRSMTAPPADPSKVALFYGQAWSLVDFLVETYGPVKIAELFATFKGGSTVDNALLAVYGVDADGLENKWRASLGLAPRDQATSTDDAG